MALPASVANKRTYRMLKPFSCNTYKKQGYPLKPSNFLCPHSARPSLGPSPFLSHSCALFARTKNSTRLFSIDFALFAQNTGRGGVLVTNRLLTLGGGLAWRDSYRWWPVCRNHAGLGSNPEDPENSFGEFLRESRSGLFGTPPPTRLWPSARRHCQDVARTAR